MADTDTNKRKTGNIAYEEHTKKYTTLLQSFIDNTTDSNNLKNNLKKKFFWIIVSIMLILVGLFSYSTYRAFEIIQGLSNTTNESAIESIIGAIVSIIPSLSTMLVSLVKLPQIIAKYLFNLKEDKNMVAIIEKIQNYDIQMYSLEQDIEDFLRKNQQNNKSTDTPAQKLPRDAQEPSDDTGNGGGGGDKTGTE